MLVLPHYLVAPDGVKAPKLCEGHYSEPMLSFFPMSFILSPNPVGQQVYQGCTLSPSPDQHSLLLLLPSGKASLI